MKALPFNANARRIINEEANREFDRRYQEMQDRIQESIARQLIAVVLYSLHVRFGFGKKRLREVFDEITSTFEDMNGVGIVKPFDTGDLIRRCREDFGIDLTEVRCEPSVKKKH